ncbi:MAG TPA: hypothetical protein VL359_15470 [bacterium]|nr:hypothetical protein [bacterium]
MMQPLAVKHRAPRLGALAWLLPLAVLLLAGCLHDAADQSYNYTNALDPNQTATSTGLLFGLVDSSDQTVLLLNIDTTSQDLTSFTLQRITTLPGTVLYTFSSYTIPGPGYTRLHFGNTSTNPNTQTDIYISTPLGLTNGDSLALVNTSGTQVVSCLVGTTC